MANRKNTFLLKRSNVIGKVPNLTGLTIGELALNVSDSKLYSLYTGGATGATEVRQIGWDRVSRTGDTITGDLYVTGKTITGQLQVTGGTLTSGYVLTSDGSGNAIWQAPTGGSSGDYLPLSGGTVTGATSFNSGLTANTIYTDYIDFNTGATVTQSTGRVSWDSGTGTLNISVGDVGTGFIDLQVGQEEVVRVYNGELTTLVKGEVVYVSGSQGNKPAVKRASAVSDGYSVTTLGMVDSNISSGDEGYVTTFGIISNLNTSGLTGGTPIWLSPTTPGTYTTTKPIAPYHTVLIGYVVRVSDTVGSIFVNISNGWELDEIHDVRISGVTTGDLLMRSSYSGSPVWVNTKTLEGSYTINGGLTVTGTTSSETISATTYQNLPQYSSSTYDKLGVVTATTVGNDFNTGIQISQTPQGYVDVKVNGLSVDVGDGVTTLDSYFSSNGLSGGVRYFSSITSNDFFVWNGVIADYDLDSTDTVSFHYIIKN
jgi:hypothetical protein